jgi:hypothetical protein
VWLESAFTEWGLHLATHLVSLYIGYPPPPRSPGYPPMFHLLPSEHSSSHLRDSEIFISSLPGLFVCTLVKLELSLCYWVIQAIGNIQAFLDYWSGFIPTRWYLQIKIPFGLLVLRHISCSYMGIIKLMARVYLWFTTWKGPIKAEEIKKAIHTHVSKLPERIVY